MSDRTRGAKPPVQGELALTVGPADSAASSRAAQVLCSPSPDVPAARLRRPPTRPLRLTSPRTHQRAIVRPIRAVLYCYRPPPDRVKQPF